MLNSFGRSLFVLVLAAIGGVAAGILLSYVWPVGQGGSGAESQASVSVSPEAAVPPQPSDWNDQPVSPGDWAWSQSTSQSRAAFADDRLVISCGANARTLTLSVALDGAENPNLAIVTTTGAHAFTGQTDGQSLKVVLSAENEVLDAMVFSRGKFMVQVGGTTPLVLPSWPELARVIEDCR